MMRKLLAGGMAALTLAGGVLAPAAEAQARDYRYHHRYHHRHRDNDGAALAAGIAGLAIGAALASNSRRGYYDDGPRIYTYRRGYYDGGPRYYRPYAYDSYYGRPRSCRTTSYYDDWDGRYTERTRCW